MTASDFIDAGITIEDTNIAVLYAEAALDWIENNTTLVVERSNLASLPAGAKLFIFEYGRIMKQDKTVASESLGGMSQSFNTESRENMLYDLASEFLGKYMKSQVKVISAKRKWD